MSSKNQEQLEARIRELEPPYESEAEAQIGRAFDRHVVPFFYRQARLIYHDGYLDIWRPTYTLPTYDSLVIEYAAPNTGLDYAQRGRIYQANGIPTVVATPADLEQRGWEGRLLRSVDTAYQNARSAWYREQWRER